MSLKEANETIIELRHSKAIKMLQKTNYCSEKLAQEFTLNLAVYRRDYIKEGVDLSLLKGQIDLTTGDLVKPKDDLVLDVKQLEKESKRKQHAKAEA